MFNHIVNLHTNTQTHRYEEWKAPGLYVIIGGIEVAKGVAEGALAIANEGLTLAIDALEASGAVLPDLDPVAFARRQ